MNARIVRLLGAVGVPLLLTVAQLWAKEPSQPWLNPDPAALNAWREMRFGMFIHWGPVSLTGREIGWSRGAQTPIEEYDNLYKRFNPTRFNADEWVAIAKAAGMKYIVLTTKHHDGFCLWDTQFTDYNIMNCPFQRRRGRGVVRGLQESRHRFRHLLLGLRLASPRFPAHQPGRQDEARKSPIIDAYNRYLLGQIKELITNYGPLLTIWNDVPQMFNGAGRETIKLVRTLQPDILVNNRTGDGGDYDTPEQQIGGFKWIAHGNRA